MTNPLTPLDLITVPHPALRQKAMPVALVDDEIRTLLERMVLAMFKDDGAGLAANQVGLLKRLVVMELEKDNGEKEILKLVNPEITWKSAETEPYPQGCLSVPGVYADIIRPKEVEFCYLDENGKKQTRKGNGLLAHCIQHEIDHLNGVLFVDHLSPLKRKLLLQKSLKFVKQQIADKNLG